MENHVNMRRIIEPIFSDLLKFIGVKTTIPDLFIPQGLQTKDFFQNLKNVLIAKMTLNLKRWRTFFHNSYLNSLSTHEMYLRYVMFACDKEIGFSDNVFDRILSVCVLVINFNNETFLKSSVNFCELSVDMFMVFYERALKDSFISDGGFKQFAEYLRQHEYLASGNYKRMDPEKRLCDPNCLVHSKILDKKCESLAKEVLSTTKIKLPKLISCADLKLRLQTKTQQQAIMLAESLKHETMAKSLKSEKSRTSLKSKITASSKRETPSTQKASEATFKREMQERDSRAKLNNIDSKGKVSSTDSKLKTSDTCRKLKITEASSEREKTKSNSKHETKTVAPIRKAFETVFKCEKTETDSEQNRTNADSKPNAEDADSKRETTAESSNPKIKEQSLELVTKTVLQSCANSESQTNSAIEDKTQLDWYENIVRAVIKYNNSKRSDPANTNNQGERKADELLKPLKDTLKVLIKALEDSKDE